MFIFFHLQRSFALLENSVLDLGVMYDWEAF